MAEINENLGGMIEKAMADPRFAEIFGMLKSKADSGELDVSKMGELLGGSEKSHGTSEKTAMSQGGSGEERAEPSADPLGSLSKFPELMGLLGGKRGRKGDFDKHERLLCALKPYLSDNKKNAVDTVVKAAKIGDILEVFGGAWRSSPPTDKG